MSLRVRIISRPSVSGRTRAEPPVRTLAGLAFPAARVVGREPSGVVFRDCEGVEVLLQVSLSAELCFALFFFDDYGDSSKIESLDGLTNTLAAPPGFTSITHPFPGTDTSGWVFTDTVVV